MLNKNKKFAFAIELADVTRDPNNFYKKGIVSEILKLRNEFPTLTVAGLDNPVVRRGIEYASNNNLLTIGTAKTHDVEWVERPNYAREKGYAPVLDSIKDFKTILARLRKYAEEHHGATTVGLSGGRVAIIHRNMVKIGYKCYSLEQFAKVLTLTKDDVKALYFNA